MSASDFFRKLQPLFESTESKAKYKNDAKDAFKKPVKLAKDKVPEGTEFFRKYSDMIAEAEEPQRSADREDDEDDTNADEEDDLAEGSDFFHNPNVPDDEQLAAPPEEIDLPEDTVTEGFDSPRSIAVELKAMYDSNENNVQQIAAESPEFYRAVMYTLLPNGEEMDMNDSDQYWAIVTELEELFQNEGEMNESNAENDDIVDRIMDAVDEGGPFYDYLYSRGMVAGHDTPSAEFLSWLERHSPRDIDGAALEVWEDFNGGVNEQVDLTELDKSTLSSYKKKANKDYNKMNSQAGKHLQKADAASDKDSFSPRAAKHSAAADALDAKMGKLYRGK